MKMDGKKIIAIIILTIICFSLPHIKLDETGANDKKLFEGNEQIKTNNESNDVNGEIIEPTSNAATETTNDTSKNTINSNNTKNIEVESVTEINNNTKNIEVESVTEINNNNTSNSKVENNTKTGEPVILDNNAPTTKTLIEQNRELINEIQRIYGYEVSYNEESYWFGDVEELTDEEVAHEALLKLKDASAIFPTGFFRTIQGYNGFRVELYQHIEGAAGVASYEFGDDNYLALDVNNGYLGRTFYHETYHLMEQYIRYKTYNQSFPFDNWNNLNPIDFKYGDTGVKYTAYDLNAMYSYTTPSTISFVSEYAKTNDREDRAELFADLMFRGFKKPYMYAGYGINEKAKALAFVLRDYFPNSVGARWEKYISF